MIAVSDSHALIWALTGKQKKIGVSARRYFQRAESGSGNVVIYVPTISLVEISDALDSGRVSFPVTFSQWVDSLFSSGHYLSAHLTPEVAVASRELRGIPDSFDRMIAATALVLGCPLLTKDPEIVEGSRGRVQVIWD